MSIFKYINLFAGLNDEEIQKIESISQKRNMPKNSIIINEGDKTDSLYVVVSGKAHAVCSDEEGKQIVLNFFGSGDYFGEMSFLTGEDRSATVLTKEKSQFLVVPRKEFQEIVKDHPEMLFHLIGGLVTKLRKATKFIENLAFKDVYGRVASFFNENTEGDGTVTEKFTHQEIANFVGASRETVSRILKELIGGGYLTKNEGRYKVNRKLPFRF